MNMKRKLLSILIVMAMGTSLLAGCGANEANGTSGNAGTNVNQDENKEVNFSNSENTEVGMQTCEFPACVEGQTGILTYNGDFVQVSDSDKINGADFDVKVADANRTDTIAVTLSVNIDTDAEAEIQNDKEWMETKAKTFQISEIKEATINEIPVQYYSCIYSTNGENENQYFNCFIEFPTIEEYYNYTIMLRIDGKQEEELILGALENLLVDVELLGVKPLGVGEVIVENDEFDEYKYLSEQLKTTSGKIVMVYKHMDAGITWEVDPDVPSSIYIYDKNQDVCYFSVSDAASAEEYANNILQWNDYLEIGTQEEIQLAGRTIHVYHFVDKETGDVFLSEGVIELASDAVFTFSYNHMNYSESGLEEVLEALRFIVE